MPRSIALLFSLVMLASSCATTGARLTDVGLKMSKAEVRSVLGAPESVALAFMDEQGRSVEVLEWRLYQYAGAIDGLSPYYNMYSFLFLDDSLIRYVKTHENARLTEEMALEIIKGNRRPVQTNIQINN
jgi:hypothetical protein